MLQRNGGRLLGTELHRQTIKTHWVNQHLYGSGSSCMSGFEYPADHLEEILDKML